MTLPPESSLARFAATFLVGVTAALITNVLSAVLDGFGIRHTLRLVLDGLVGGALLVGILAALEGVNYLAVRYYVVIALAGGVGCYAALAAPVVTPPVRRVAAWPGKLRRGIAVRLSGSGRRRP